MSHWQVRVVGASFGVAAHPYSLLVLHAAGESTVLWNKTAVVAELAQRIDASVNSAAKKAERRLASSPLPTEKETRVPLFDNNYDEQVLLAARRRRRARAPKPRRGSSSDSSSGARPRSTRRRR